MRRSGRIDGCEMVQLLDASSVHTIQNPGVVQADVIESMAVVREGESTAHLIKSLTSVSKNACDGTCWVQTYLTYLNLRVSLGHTFP